MASLRILLSVAFVVVCAGAQAADGVRIKDITSIQNVRINKLVGIGLVTGLNRTGGRNPVTRQFAQNFLQRMGLRADAALRQAVRDDTKERTDNLSVVTVTAEFPAFAKRGSRIDVTVSAFDDASSLQGGTLINTPLLGLDNEVYAIASGPVSIGGFSFRGNAASITKNHPTVGRIPNGGSVEQEIRMPIGEDGRIRLLLDDADYETAGRIAEAIRLQGSTESHVIDPGTVEVVLSFEQQLRMATTIGRLRNLVIIPDTKARVVINERTGTIVIGSNVRISNVGINHGNLVVINTETPEAALPNPFAGGGAPVVLPRTDQQVVEEESPINVIPPQTTVGDVAAALNALGVTPRDLSAIFQQLKTSGALHAELEFN